MLAVLLLSAGRPVPTAQIVDAVWPDDPPANGPNVVQKHVAGLRRVLEPDRSPRTPAQVLTLTDAGYLLRIDPETVDAVRFERAVRRAERHRGEGRPAEALAELAAALELWHGEPFGGFTGPVLEAARHRLVETRATALETRAELELERGRHRELVGELVRLVAEFPLRERLRQQLMLALHRSGRQAEALAAYREFAGLLRDEFGIEPGEVLQELNRRILRADPTLTPAAPALPGPAASPPTPAGAAPPPVTAGETPAGYAVPASRPAADPVPAPPTGPPVAAPAATRTAALPVPPVPAPPVPGPAVTQTAATPALVEAAVPTPLPDAGPATGSPAPAGTSSPAPGAAAGPDARPAVVPAGRPFPSTPPPFLPDPPPAPPRRQPAPRWVSVTATVVGSLLVLLSFGCFTWLVVLGYAAWRRSWRLALVGLGYLGGAVLLTWLLLRGDPDADPPTWEVLSGFSVLGVCWLGGAVHVVLLSREVWRVLTGRSDDGATDDRRVRREQARYLLHHYPAARFELSIGRPDLPRAFDDGGLIDVNAVGEHVLATLPGLDAARLRQVAMDRWLRGPYGSMEELAARCLLAPAVTDALRDVLVFLPPPPHRPRRPRGDRGSGFHPQDDANRLFSATGRVAGPGTLVEMPDEPGSGGGTGAGRGGAAPVGRRARPTAGGPVAGDRGAGGGPAPGALRAAHRLGQVGGLLRRHRPAPPGR
ncbi:BTAD domain-containing putative transcriptional regulator [Micromonospora psammae]|uniref:BTAD domain-containing putative transcriptional regulator n=1 Tax=Micromonospora sp. CPCC 205556 TaxID=3122398 RepID=UPI003FA5C5D6